MKPFRFSTPASAELAEAVRWYETRRTGLGADFYDAVGRAAVIERHGPSIDQVRRDYAAQRMVFIRRASPMEALVIDSVASHARLIAPSWLRQLRSVQVLRRSVAR